MAILDNICLMRGWDATTMAGAKTFVEGQSKEDDIDLHSFQSSLLIHC